MSIKKPNELNHIWFIIVLSSLFACIFLLFDFDRPQYYLLLPMLPFSFAAVNIVSADLYNYIYKNIGLSLIICLYYIRIVAVPVIMSVGGYSSLEKLNIYTNMPWAVVLMMYELIAVYAALYYAAAKTSNLKHNDSPKNKKSPQKIKGKTFAIIMIIMIAFDIAVYLLIPESKYIYTDIFSAMKQTSYDVYNYEAVVARGSIKRACVTLFSMTMGFVRIFAPSYFIIDLRKKYGEQLKGIILSVPFIMFQFILVSNTQADSILCAFVLMLLLVKLYPSWSKTIYKGSIITGGLFIIFYFAYKHSTPSGLYGGITGAARASQLVNAYFSGPDNVASSFNIITKDKWGTLFYTLVSSIPFNGTLFGIKGANISSLYNFYNGSEFQIAPCIGESYFYFGALLAPLLPVLLAVLAVHCGSKAQGEKNMWKYITYVYFALLSAISLILYDGTIFLKTFNEMVVPMIILSNLSKPPRLGRKCCRPGIKYMRLKRCCFKKFVV